MTDSDSSVDSPRPDRPSDDRWLGAVLLLMLGVAAWMLTSSWRASILDRYEFRQLQTAISVFWMKQEGLRLDYLTPLFGPPWTIPMEFPTYQWCVALLSNLSGMALEQTGRLVGILFYLAMLPAVYGLMEIAGLARTRRWLVLAVVLSTPVYLFYPRTVMIESTALCFSVWFLYALHRMLTKHHWGWFAATCGLGLLAALTKVTTFVIYGVPAAALTLAAVRRQGRQNGSFHLVAAMRPALLAVVPAALAIGAALWWVARGDAVKHSNPFTGFLTSTELRRWNYGWLGLRFESSFWMQMVKNITENVLSEGALALGVLAATFASAAARRVALVCLLGFFAGPLVFANLYHIHDYYYTANALLLTGAVGLLLASAWDNPRLTAGPRWALLVVVLLLQYCAFDRGYHYYYWKQAPTPPDIATIMRETIPADGVVLISGADWNPLLPYYSQRRALMVPADRDDEAQVLEDVLARLPPRRIAAMVVVGDRLRQSKDFLRARAARFGFSPRAFASSDDGDLYLPANMIVPAAGKLQGRQFNRARVLVTSAVDAAIPGAQEQDLSGQAFPMCTPAPQHARSRFGISTEMRADGPPLIIAHAPSEIYFHPPPGARKITAIVGLAASAYANPLPAASDGIIVEIFTEQPNGLRRSLYHRHLTPATIPADRGPQEVTYQQDTPLTETLVFSATPGPAGNESYDQAYWGRIEIR